MLLAIGPSEKVQARWRLTSWAKDIRSCNERQCYLRNRKKCASTMAKQESRNFSTVSRVESTDGSADTSLPYICKPVSPKPPCFYFQEIEINRPARRTKKDALFDRALFHPTRRQRLVRDGT